jgi:Golgi nucleoside diphosphatase
LNLFFESINGNTTNNFKYICTKSYLNTIWKFKEILATFGIEKTNNGASTGSEWINTKGEQIDSYSPVDGP